MGDREKNLITALNFLLKWGKIAPVSPVYRTTPMGMAPGTPDFFNLAVGFESNLSPLALLSEIKTIEEKMGREPSAGAPRSRPIDIDILTAENLRVESSELTIPHPRMWKRAFVIHPMADIAPDLVHSETGITMKEARRQLSSPGQVERLGPLPLGFSEA